MRFIACEGTQRVKRLEESSDYNARLALVKERRKEKWLGRNILDCSPVLGKFT